MLFAGSRYSRCLARIGARLSRHLQASTGSLIVARIDDFLPRKRVFQRRLISTQTSLILLVFLERQQQYDTENAIRQEQYQREQAQRDHEFEQQQNEMKQFEMEQRLHRLETNQGRD